MGVMARPAGAYVIKDGSVSWQPAVDANRVLLIGGMLGAAALLALGRLAAAAVFGPRARRPLLPFMHSHRAWFRAFM